MQHAQFRLSPVLSYPLKGPAQLTVLISGSIVRPHSLRDQVLCPSPQPPPLTMAALLHTHLQQASGAERTKGWLEADVPLCHDHLPRLPPAVPTPTPGPFPACLAASPSSQHAGLAGHALPWLLALECVFPSMLPQGNRHGIIEYISPEPIQPRALYKQCLLTELIFAK